MFINADEMINSFTLEQEAEWEENFKLNNDLRITRFGEFFVKVVWMNYHSLSMC